MLQNKLLFNQSSVSLEVIGLPDYSNDENKDQISIISQWKLTIIDKPIIEGNIDHLMFVMEAFYSYSYLLINSRVANYESELIDIKTDNFYSHNVLLKSSKLEVGPLNIKIGNSALSDIISCFDQFNSSDKVRKIKANASKNINKNPFFSLINKEKISNFVLPPFLSLCSIFVISSAFITFYNNTEI